MAVDDVEDAAPAAKVGAPRMWVLLACEVGKRVLQSDPSGKPLTFPRLIAALQFAVLSGAPGDEGRVLLRHRLLAEEVMRDDPVGPEDAGAPWWPRMQALLSGSLQGALDASVTGDEDALGEARSEVLFVTTFCETLFGLSEVDLRAYGDEFAVAVQGLTFEPERQAVELDETLKAMGVFDVDEFAKELTGPLIAQARMAEAASQRREDGMLLRGLAGAWGIQATRGWKSQPWIVIPGTWLDERRALMGRLEAPPPGEGVRDWMRARGEEAWDPAGLSVANGVAILEHAPWRSAILQVPVTWDDEVSLKWRLTAPPRWIRYAPLMDCEASLYAQRPWLEKSRVQKLSNGAWLIVDVVATQATLGRGTSGQPPPLSYDWAFNSFALDGRDPWGDGGVVPLGHGVGIPVHGRLDAPFRTNQNWMSTDEIIFLARGVRAELLLYLEHLSEGEEHPVAVQPPQDRQAAPWKKPWLRRDRPYVILLDPSGRAHRRTEPGPSTGQHVRLHQRRGHWRHYRSERYSDERRALRQWIRQSWAGDREWVTAGATYRVMTNPDGSLDTGQGG